QAIRFAGSARPRARGPSPPRRRVLLHPPRSRGGTLSPAVCPPRSALGGGRRDRRIFRPSHLGRPAYRRPPERLQQAAPRHDRAALELASRRLELPPIGRARVPRVP